MKHLICIHGPWQALAAAAAWRQHEDAAGGDQPDVLLYAPESQQELLDTMAAYAARLFAGAAVHIASTDQWSTECAELGRRLGAEASDARTVWVTKIFSPAEKELLAAFPCARVVLYEDGLHSYLQQERADTLLRRALDWVDPGVASRRTEVERAGYIDNQRQRVDRCYWLLRDALPVPPYLAGAAQHDLSWEGIRTCIGIVDADAPPRAGGDGALFLGQCFAEYGALARDTELEGYRETIARIAEHGMRVVWKEHPRNQRPFFPELRRELGDAIVEAETSATEPIELLASRAQYSACVSVCSSSLFYLPRLTGTPSYTLAAEPWINRISYRDFRKIATMTAGHIAPVNDFYAEHPQ